MDTSIPEGLLPPRRGADGETELGPPYGETVQLPSGQGAVTHYRLDPPQDPPSSEASGRHTVVMINGVNDFSVRFGRMAKSLTAKGFSVLRYDGYGRGWSSVPDAAKLKFDIAMHLKQLEELVAHLELDPQQAAMSLVAHSMGGLTAVHFARAHPQLRGVVLMAPAGVMKAPAPGFAVLQRAFPTLLTMMARGGPTDPPPGDFYDAASVNVAALQQWDLDWHRAHSKVNGKLAFAASVAQMPMVSNEAAVRGMAAVSADTKLPVLLLHADNDPHVVLRPQDIEVYRNIFGDRLTTMLVESAGHCFFLQYPEKVTNAIAEFLDAHAA